MNQKVTLQSAITKSIIKFIPALEIDLFIQWNKSRAQVGLFAAQYVDI